MCWHGLDCVEFGAVMSVSKGGDRGGKHMGVLVETRLLGHRLHFTDVLTQDHLLDSIYLSLTPYATQEMTSQDAE